MLPRSVIRILAVTPHIHSRTAGQPFCKAHRRSGLSVPRQHVMWMANRMLPIISLWYFFSLLLSGVPAYPAVFNVASGNVQGLIGAINTANANGEANTIHLAPGVYPSLISPGNNVFGDPTGCNTVLQPSDFTGDPGLGAFIDDEAPGHGRFSLLPGSPAVDAGNDTDLVTVGNISTGFDATPVPGGPAGTSHITADFTNTSDQAIVNPFAEVVELSGGNLLLNANGGAGARMTPPDSLTTPFEPGTVRTFQFRIGLQKQEPFTFFVNMFGERLTSNSLANLPK